MSKFVNNMKTVVLMALLTALILWIGSFFGTGGLYMALILAAVMNFVSFFFSDKIAILMMRGQAVGPEHELYGIVQQLASVRACRCRACMSRRTRRPTPLPPGAARATHRSARHRDCSRCSVTRRSPA
jgi:heat shock protein HtpX